MNAFEPLQYSTVYCQKKTKKEKARVNKSSEKKTAQAQKSWGAPSRGGEKAQLAAYRAGIMDASSETGVQVGIRFIALSLKFAYVLNQLPF